MQTKGKTLPAMLKQHRKHKQTMKNETTNTNHILISWTN
jgi:hypothetical protein